MGLYKTFTDGLALAIVCVASIWIVQAAIKGRRAEKDGDWHFAETGRMKRYVNGKWQYRPETSDETEARIDLIA